jgi:hypothetical protein
MIMKKMTMLKSIATVALFTVFGMSASAQVIAGLPAAKAITAPSDTSSLADTVSLNAVMPYYVHPDGVIKSSSLYNPSGFKWTIAGAGATLNTGSLTTTAIGGVGTYYLDTMVVATYASLGNITVSTIERSSPKFSPTSGCDGNTRNLTVNVIPLPLVPTIATTDTAQGGCSASAPFTVKFNFSASTAKYPAYIQYTVKAYDISGVAIGTPQTYWYQINGATDNISVPQTQLDAASGGSNVNGRYAITLGSLYDRISSNATNRASLAVDASAVKAAIMVLPTPNTGVIKHIKTL